MAQALRQAGENEFYPIVEYAEAYHWHVENVRIIRETDTQFGICGIFNDPWYDINPEQIICKCEIQNGTITTSFFTLDRGKSPDDYGNYNDGTTKEAIIKLLTDWGDPDE
jgi:hypothetical protein